MATRGSESDAGRVHKTVGVYEKPANSASRISRPALYVSAIALAVGLGAAALYWF